MMETLLEWDRQLLLAINGMNTPFWDDAMWIISGKFTWIPLYLIFIYVLYKQYGMAKTGIIILGTVLAVVISDLTATYLFKEQIQRLRPSHASDLEGLLHFVNDPNGNPYLGGQYGFISNHASNMAAVGTLVILMLKKKGVWAVIIPLWVLLIGYSRVYLGVHYPLDVMCGFIWGAFIGWLVDMLIKRYVWIQEFFT